MKQIIVYDISNDRLRERVCHTVQDYGFKRLQYSVYKGSRSRNILEALSIEIQDILGDEEADVRFYLICNKCLEKTMVVSKKGIDNLSEVMFPCRAS